MGGCGYRRSGEVTACVRQVMMLPAPWRSGSRPGLSMHTDQPAQPCAVRAAVVVWLSCAQLRVLDRNHAETADTCEFQGGPRSLNVASDLPVTIHGLAAFTGEGRGVVQLLLDGEAVAVWPIGCVESGVGRQPRPRGERARRLSTAHRRLRRPCAAA